MSIDEIAIRIKAARKDARMTQAEVAARLGITYQAISNYERGVTRIDTDTLVKLCAVYDIPVSSIIDSTAPASAPSYAVDAELNEYLEMLKTRPECRMLFSLTKDATKEDVEKAVAIIEALRKTEGK